MTPARSSRYDIPFERRGAESPRRTWKIGTNGAPADSGSTLHADAQERNRSTKRTAMTST